jgi:hypothetical protein
MLQVIDVLLVLSVSHQLPPDFRASSFKAM